MLWLGAQLGLVDELEVPDDPREALDLVYSRQLELQAKARRAVVDVVTARKRIELQARQLGPTVSKLDEQVRVALQQGREESAREALTWRTTLQGELAELDRHTASLVEEEARLRQVASRLELRAHQLRIRRDALRASYAAARARAEVGQALADARQADSELTTALREAEDRVGRTRAAASSLEGLAARSALQAATAAAASPSHVQRTDAEVAEELTRLEEELLWGPAAQDERKRDEEGRPPG